MKNFLFELYQELRVSANWHRTFAFAIIVFAVYGMFLVNPVTTYDFNAAKGDSFQVFLTYFFMHRIFQGVISGFFHDFTPFWTVCIGLIFMLFAMHLLSVLLRRLGFSSWQAFLGCVLWLSTPFIFNHTIYQHAFPAETMTLCLDIIAMLCFETLIRDRSGRKSIWCLTVILVAMSTSVYQAHASLLLTAFLAICVFKRANDFKQLLSDWMVIISILISGIALWFVVNHGPMLIAKACGIVIPKSGGAHDAIYWFTGDRSFLVNVKGLFVGLLLNWGYNAFFVVGLRVVLLALFCCFGYACGSFFVKKQRAFALSIFSFAMSVFAFPLVQCSSVNLRIFYCFIPLIVFTGMLVLRKMERRPRGRVFSVCVVAIFAVAMAHETSTLYYYNWKVKEHDKLHMSIVAHDLWAKYGLTVKKPVAIVGGWKHYPTCWEDLRPFRQLPLIGHPFTTYSNMSSLALPREFYMVAREKIGLVARMPDLDGCAKLASNDEMIRTMPAYPMHGYIFETNDVIVVNLGPHETQWSPFKYGDYASPNEKLLQKTLRLDRLDAWLVSRTQWLRDLAERYKWTTAIN